MEGAGQKAAVYDAIAFFTTLQRHFFCKFYFSLEGKLLWIYCAVTG